MIEICRDPDRIRATNDSDWGWGVLAEERRTRLLEFLRKQGFASLPELSRLLDCSDSTVRRDLEQLEKLGSARRTHGGVFYVGGNAQLSHFEERQPAQWDLKRQIAERAAELIEDGDTVLFDGGSTTYEVAQRVVGRPLQIVTNSIPIANLFAADNRADLVLLGGYVYPRTGVALGPLADAMLEKIRVRKTIMGVGGITSQGLFNSNVLLAATEQAMIRAADEVVVVADSSKLGRRNLAFLAPLSAVHRLVMDSGVSEAWRTELRAAGIRLEVAGEPSSSSAPVGAVVGTGTVATGSPAGMGNGAGESRRPG